MRDDLLFHITTRDEWEKYKNAGTYEPQSLEEQGFISFSPGNKLEEIANKRYPDKDKILLLVIDVSMIREQIKYEEEKGVGEKIPHLYEPLSVNAVIDKIDVQAEKNGKFSISFTSDT